MFAYCLGTVEHVHLEIVDLSIYFAIGQSILCTCRVGMTARSSCLFRVVLCIFCLHGFLNRLAQQRFLISYGLHNRLCSFKLDYANLCDVNLWQMTCDAYRQWSSFRSATVHISRCNGVTLISYARNVHPDRAWLRHVHELPDRRTTRSEAVPRPLLRECISRVYHCFITIRLTGQGQWRLLWINIGPSLFR